MPEFSKSGPENRTDNYSKVEQEKARKYFEWTTTITAGERWINELQFQIMRMEQHVVSRTEEEKEYHARLLEGYKTGARYSNVLLNYLKGRLAKLNDGAEEPDEIVPAIMEGGRVAPVFEDEEPSPYKEKQS